MTYQKVPCPVCKNTKGNLILTTRNNIPSLQNIALKTQKKALQFPTVDLEMMWCADCSFVWNSCFDPAKILYDEGYNNDVSSSDYYVSHLEEMADRIIRSIPEGEDIHYVEIGCGEGDFLRLVVERAKGRCVSAIGFDPSFTGQDKLPEGAVVYTDFFGPEQIKLIPEMTNVVCSRHTIEHVSDVHAFVKSLAEPISTGERKLFVETPTADWILENNAFQDFFYEHCSIYTPHSIERIMNQYGLWAKVDAVYGGQYMWIEAGRDDFIEKAAIPMEVEIAHSFVKQSTSMLNDWKRVIEKSTINGKVAIWGAASKGVTFNLLMSKFFPDGEGVSCAIDLNVEKQDCYLPVTGLSILKPETAKELGVDTIIIMNSNYVDEIKNMVRKMDWSPDFLILN